MNISEVSVRRPVFMAMIYLALMVIALLMVPGMDIALYPSIEMPVITVMASCGTYGPNEITQQVIKPLENALYNLSGLDTMMSQASTGNAFVALQFDFGTDMDKAYDLVQSAVSRVQRALPDWVSSTNIMSMNSFNTNSEIMSIVVTGNRSLNDLKDYADDEVSPILERVSGVAQVSVRGGSVTTYEVNVIPERLYAYNLTIAQISSALSDANTQQYLGTLTQNDMEYTITTDNRFSSASDISNTVITGSGQQTVRISDVATVKLSDERSSRSFINGNEVVTLSVSNESDSNATTVARRVRAAIEELQENVPSDITVSINRDSTQMISSTMNQVYKTAAEGVILAALVIFLFLRNIKATIIISLSMPICIVFTLMLMSIFGISVNFLSMAGLVLAIGMIVDASIIILENTFVYREKGYKSAVAAILGSKNMLNAIVASTLTTICVFLPMIIMKNELGMMGVMFQDMVITVCVSLASSLFVSVTLVPALAGSIFKVNTRTQKPLKNRVLRSVDNFFARIETGLENGYQRSLDYFLSHKLLLIVLLLLLLVLSTLLLSSSGFSLMPQMRTDDSVNLSLTLEPGTVMDVTLEKLFAMQDKVMEILPEDAYTTINLQVSGGNNSGSLRINLPDVKEQTMSATEIRNLLRPLTTEDPEATWNVGGGGMGFSMSAVSVEVASENDELASQTIDSIMALLQTGTDKLVDVSSDLSNGSPKVDVQIDYDKAKELGVSISNLQTTLYMALNGVTATQITTFDTSVTYNLQVSLKNALDNLSDIQAITVMGSAGPVRLDQVATFEYGVSPRSIYRENKVRVNNVTANAATGVSSDEAQRIAKDLIDNQLFVPEGVEITIGGEMQEFDEYLKIMIKVILVALALVYMVMAAQFESLIDPFIIFATIPLLLIGVVMIHLMMGMQFSLFSLVGIVALLGVVVNNGIVLVDAINQLVKTKMPVRHACLVAAKSRLRPILMTTLTTALGLVPMAFFPGDGGEMMQPIGATFFGGLVTGAFLTLFLSPTLYLIFNKRVEKKYDNPNSLNNQLIEYDTLGPVSSLVSTESKVEAGFPSPENVFTESEEIEEVENADLDDLPPNIPRKKKTDEDEKGKKKKDKKEDN